MGDRLTEIKDGLERSPAKSEVRWLLARVEELERDADTILSGLKRKWRSEALDRAAEVAKNPPILPTDGTAQEIGLFISAAILALKDNPDGP